MHNTENLFYNQVRTASKKAGGSTSNGRDSAGRRLGVKLLHGRIAKAGAIIIRQRGTKFHVGQNVGIGKDHTIFSKVLGIVNFTRNAKKKVVVNVVQVDGVMDALARGKKGIDMHRLEVPEIEDQNILQL